MIKIIDDEIISGNIRQNTCKKRYKTLIYMRGNFL
jgi:hypothetical protein